MSIIVFSDCHLGKSLDLKKYKFLEKLIKSSDRVIINGDFWEGFDITFEEFIQSPWKKLFPLLRQKNTVYVYGNHDLRSMSDKKVSLFSSTQTEQYKLKLKNKVFVFEHGHRFVPLADYFFARYLKTVPPTWLSKTFAAYEGTMVKLFGKKYLEKIYGIFNKDMKAKMKREIKNNEFHIFGHTHLNEVDNKSRFANCGFIRHGLGQYLSIDSKGEITSHEEWYV